LFRRSRSKLVKDEEAGIGTFIRKSIDKINDEIDDKEGKNKGKGYVSATFLIVILCCLPK